MSSEVIALNGGICLSQQRDDETPCISESCLQQQVSTGTQKRTEQNLIVHIGKPKAEVTDNTRSSAIADKPRDAGL